MNEDLGPVEDEAPADIAADQAYEDSLWRAER